MYIYLIYLHIWKVTYVLLSLLGFDNGLFSPELCVQIVRTDTLWLCERIDHRKFFGLATRVTDALGDSSQRIHGSYPEMYSEKN